MGRSRRGMDVRGGLLARLHGAGPLRGADARSAAAVAPAPGSGASAGGRAAAAGLADGDGPAPPGGDAARLRPCPLATTPRLRAAPMAPTDVRFPINLATALRLSDARPLIVAAAQASVWVAEAELTQAKVLWLPDLNHRLRLHPPRRRRPRLQQGDHDRAEHELLLRRCRPLGIELGIISTTDAIYQPLVARQVLNSRHWDVQAAKNDALMQTADAYFMVHQSRGMYAGTPLHASSGATT